ncbi:MAG: transglycosylase SLT domain-containing protein, partial [Betaproteobacteria bacterium]|nr:transglycosylase SLT domain-containing protein [Betaproteobacteria bacterium]
MGELNSPLVQEQENWYASRPDYIQRFVERGSRYLYHIVEESERRGLPTEIALLPIIESAFNPQAYSRAKAAGMWQFIPATGKNFGLTQDWAADHRLDVVRSTTAAMDYLQRLYQMFNSWELAFAAYNCGEGCVARAIAKNERKGLPTDFLSLNLPNETRSYVPKLIAVKNIILSPGSYGIDLSNVDNRPYFTKVAAPEKIDIKLAARLAEMTEEEFNALNPAFIKPVAKNSDGYFLVPTDKAAVFRSNLEQYRALNGPLVSWQTVVARQGEAVDAVARRHGMTASHLRATSSPFKERKGRFSQNTTFMVPIPKQAEVIQATLNKKSSLN